MGKNNSKEIEPGTKFNRLIIVKYVYQDKRFRRFYLCKCDCGKEKIIQGSLITSNNTKSCGCLSKEIKSSKRISKHHSEITAIILGYKRHARERGFEWLLSRYFVEILIKNNCFYCGSPPSNIQKTKNSIGSGMAYSGIDRINSKKDYTENNVVACCKICNYAKGKMTLIEFQDWAIKIGKNAMSSKWSNF